VPVSRNTHNTVTSQKSGWQHETYYWCALACHNTTKILSNYVTTAVEIHSKYIMVMKYIYCDLPYLRVWCHLNFFSGLEEGCFHVIDAFVGFMINTGFVHCNSVLQTLFYMVGILCPMQEGKFHSVVCDHL
jgi:hypothetical protein